MTFFHCRVSPCSWGHPSFPSRRSHLDASSLFKILNQMLHRCDSQYQNWLYSSHKPILVRCCVTYLDFTSILNICLSVSPLPPHHLKEEWSNLEGERNRVRILGNLRNGKLMTWNEHLSEMAFFSFDSPTVMMTYKAAFKPQDFAVLWKKKFHPDLKPRPFRPPELGTTSPTLLPPHLQKLSLKQFLSKNN